MKHFFILENYNMIDKTIDIYIGTSKFKIDLQ